MSILSLFAFTIFAAETIISPLADTASSFPVHTSRPDVSFGQIITPTAVLGAQTEIVTTVTPTPPPLYARKKQYTIAFLGDSMVDTLGPGIPHLKNSLSHLYNGVTFTILNYGVGATNIDYGIERITNSYNYLGNQIPALIEAHPDIVVIESFGYNPFPVADGRDRHWLALARAVDTVKKQLPGAKIIIAATIAPNSQTFGDGAPGIAFTPQDKQNRTKVIKEYLESTVQFAKSQKLPLANAYYPSLDASGDGRLSYINGGDHIHYSDAGRALMAQKVTEAITNNHLLE